MSTQEIYIDPRQFDNAVGDALERGAEGGLKRVGLKIEKLGRAKAPVDSGSLRSSITSQPRGDGLGTTVTVGPNARGHMGAPYDIFQEMGTGIYAEDFDGNAVAGRHRIKPRRGSALRFPTKGEGWKRVTKIGWSRSKGGKLKTHISSSSSQYHGDMAVVKSVAGVKPKHYMRDAVKETDFEAEFVKGFDSTR